MEIFRRLTSPFLFLAWISLAALGVLGMLWLMLMLPGHSGTMCMMNGILQPMSVVFSVVFAVLVSANLVLLPEVFRNTAYGGVQHKLWSGIPIVGSILGIFTVFCTVCTLPVLLLFGVSISLSFFVTYSVWIQLGSILLLLGSLWLIERVLRRVCVRCVV